MEQTYCLTPAEWRYAQGCLTLAKRWGLIEDDTPAALEARRAAKNAEISRREAEGAPRYTAHGTFPPRPTCNLS